MFFENAGTGQLEKLCIKITKEWVFHLTGGRFLFLVAGGADLLKFLLSRARVHRPVCN